MEQFEVVVIRDRAGNVLMVDSQPTQGFQVVWDGTRRTSRQLFTPEYPRAVGLPEPHKRLATEARKTFNAGRQVPVFQAAAQALNFDREAQ